MAAKNKKVGEGAFLIHYYDPIKKVYNFSISIREHVEKKKLELMLLGMEDINSPLLDKKLSDEKKVVREQVEWDNYSMEDLKNMKRKRRIRK